MDYISVSVSSPEHFTQLLISSLFEVGFDSFQENADGSFIAGTSKTRFDEQTLRDILGSIDGVSYTLAKKSKVNWNEEWEKNYDPILIEDKCLVRASFHAPDPNVQHELIITPKMSFGTGHHDTTYQMLSYQMSVDFLNKTVLDVGCGTAILSILALKLGAKQVVAVDIDGWCIENSEENFKLNGIESGTRYQLIQGEIGLVDQKDFDIILANINKNVLLDQLESYAARLKTNGVLILSGFYKADIPDMIKEAEKHFLRQKDLTNRNRWAMLSLKKHTV